MVDRISPRIESLAETVETPKTRVVDSMRESRRNQIRAVIDDLRSGAVNNNAYHMKSVVPMAGSGETLRRGKRTGRYRP